MLENPEHDLTPLTSLKVFEDLTTFACSPKRLKKNCGAISEKACISGYTLNNHIPVIMKLSVCHWKQQT